MLLVDYNKSEIVEVDSIFKNGMCADEDVQLAADELLVNYLALWFLCWACEKCHIHSNFR
jgi:hypothetical protein